MTLCSLDGLRGVMPPPVRRFKEKHVPPHLKARVRYLRGKQWITECELVDTDGTVWGWGYAKCSLNEQPVKKIGRAIAIGRALKMYWEVAGATG